jgi:hypothetical protein
MLVTRPFPVLAGVAPRPLVIEIPARPAATSEKAAAKQNRNRRIRADEPGMNAS